jgi:tricorn protease
MVKSSFNFGFCSLAMLVGMAISASTSAATRGPAGGAFRPHGGMMRYPAISATHIAFVYGNDIWVVPREGGVALPLASPPGQEMFPRFSPDGATIAFTGNYDGNTDLYTIPVNGGVPFRVTYHPDAEILCEWTAEGDLLYYTSGFAGLSRQSQLHRISSSSGLPARLPVPYGANGAISADGEWLAYTPHSRDHRTWKRYRGGMATDIWVFNLRDHSARKITDWEGTDTQPMWHGKNLYYLSDAGPDHRLNIWMYDTDNGRHKQVTFQKEYDVKWPSIGPGPDGGGEIVFQVGSDLKVVDLRTNAVRTVEVTIPGDRPQLRPRRVKAGENIQAGSISSTGQRAVLEARGDIWTVPAQHGTPRNLTRTSGVAERDPAWSPDGKWIAYFSDETGEYELYLMRSDGRGENRRLTGDGNSYRYNPTWSPDSKHIAFQDKTGAMFIHTIDSGETKQFDIEPWASQPRMMWAPDSRWIVYSKVGENRLSSVWLYQVEKSEKHQVTSGMFDSFWPTFDRKGDFLYMASARDFTRPLYEDVGTTFVYAGTDRLLAVPLRKDVKSPWLAKSDEEKWDEEKEKEEKPEDEKPDSDNDDSDAKDGNEENGDSPDKKDNGEKDKDGKENEQAEKEPDESERKKPRDKGKKKKEEIKPIEIDIDGFESRSLLMPVERGSFHGLAVNDKGQLIYVRRAPRGGTEQPAIKLFDPADDDKKEQTVLENAMSFSMSADGTKLLVRRGSTLAIVKAAPKQKFEKPLAVGDMETVIEPREEWRQIFIEAWRIQRDFFYDPTMHGVDWKAMLARYLPMLEDCTSREDVTYVIGELIAELNVGHAYARVGGDLEETPRVTVGMLGVDFEKHEGAYRIATIYEGAEWDADAQSPLRQAGVDVKEGDYVLAVNGLPVNPALEPWAAFQGLAGKTVTITVSDKPRIDDDARNVVVELLSGEGGLRYRAWIERNRQYVSEKSNGRVGYIYVPNTGIAGQNDLFRQFYGQIDKQALIIDERWNGGGQIPTRFIELLNRPIANYWARRDGKDWPWPPDAHQGPKCMLINGLAGSGGDYFPWYFKKMGLGKLVGMRTWGGLVGISGNPRLMDGGQITAPTFAFYESDGTWGIEGHGVDPDIEVIDDPSKMVDGGDPQLDAAIELMLREIKENPYVAPKRPPYPDRRGMGIREEDK